MTEKKKKQEPPFPPVFRLRCREDWTKEMREQYADEKEGLAYLHRAQIEDKATLKALFLLIKHSFKGKDLDYKQLDTLERRQEEIKQQQRTLAYRKLQMFELRLLLKPDAWADRWFPACETCKKRKEDVEWRIDPYNHEIHDDESKHYICGDCYDDALGDI
jgi:hypothetical protein